MKNRTTDLPTPARLLGVWAHPDDEAYLSAGLMSRITDAGGHVTLLTATRGEKGTEDPAEFDRLHFAATRERELVAAAAELGVDDVRFMNRRDGECEGTDPDAVRLICEAIAAVKPDLVVTFGPDGITNHPDHLAVSAWTTAACQAARTRLLYATMSAEFLERHREMHDAIGVFADQPCGRGVAAPDESLLLQILLDEKELDRKRRSLAAHASQTPALAAAVGEATYRTWWREESFRAPTPSEFRKAAAALRPQRQLVRAS